MNEPELFPISVEGVWGFIDRNGEVVIAPRFEHARPFSEGLACVKVPGTSAVDRELERSYEGFISVDGAFVIPPGPLEKAAAFERYDCHSYGDFHEGLARIHLNDATGIDGFIDRAGKLVIWPEFDSSRDFSEGLAYVELGRRWSGANPDRVGFIDRLGNFVIENNAFTSALDFAEGRATVEVLGKSGARERALIDTQGRYVIPPGVYSWISRAVCGAIWVVTQESVGLVDLDGKEIVSPGVFDQINESVDGKIFAAVRNGRRILIDSTGSQVAEVSASGQIGCFQGGMATIKRNGKFGYIDASGTECVSPTFDFAGPFKGSLALVRFGSTDAYVDRTGRLVWQTDQWEQPNRNGVRPPLSDFLPVNLLEAIPLSYNWMGIRNAILFSAGGELSALLDWYRRRFTIEVDYENQSIYDDRLEGIQFRILGAHERPIEVTAVDGATDEVEEFSAFLGCSNLEELKRKRPTAIHGMLIDR